MFTQLNRELNFGFRRVGSLVLAFTAEEMNTVQELLANGLKNGVSGMKILSREEVLQMEPHVNPAVCGALFCHHTGITSPYEYCIALAENAITNGVRFYLNHEVIDILRVADDTSISSHSKNGVHFLIRTNRDGDSFRAKIVINAAGLQADRIAAMVGANDFSITPRKGEYLLMNKNQGHLAKHVLFPVPQKATGKGILVSPTFHGNLLLGPTSRGAGDALTQRQVLQLIINSSRRSLPDIDYSQVITSYTGLRSTCSRGDFIIEENREVPQFINCCGIDSPGLTSSPAVAELVCKLVQQCWRENFGQQLQEHAAFNPNRKPIIIRKGAGFGGRIDDPDPQKNIICRCERVTESEIIDAVHRPLGAHTTDAMKRRTRYTDRQLITRAGMGPCQGSFCETRVAAVIARETGVPVELVGRHAAGSSLLSHRKVTTEDKQLLVEMAKLAKL
ncbi:hypothetical protein HDV03_004862 [Kappamyces sp. JEL0829]|nr:hypothetical protein HDV03_004862 [Kappamyces sp. JEL0829]